MKTLTQSLALLIAQVSLAALPAFATSVGSGAEHHMDLREMRGTQVSVQGDLACAEGTALEADNCDLTVKDSKSGKVFGLSNEERALAMFTAGVKNVAIEGALSRNGRIKISRVSSN